MKNKKVLKIILSVVAIILIVLISLSLYSPIKFKKDRDRLYDEVIERLMMIRDAQVAHKDATGEFAKNFKDLKSFIDSGNIIVTKREDVTEMVFNPRYGFEMPVTRVKIDTIANVKVKDSLFKGVDYSNLKDINLSNGKKIAVELETELKITRKANDSTQVNKTPLFRAYVNKADILQDMDENSVKKELNSEIGIKGDIIEVGSMSAPKTEGNWTKDYETRIKEKKKLRSTKK